MSQVLDQDAILKLLGDPSQVDQELTSFSETAQALSSQAPRMIEAYPKQWVALYQGTVQAHASTYRSVLEDLKKKGLPKERMIIRFIDRNPRTMIL
jgi:hypothetical protein